MHFSLYSLSERFLTLCIDYFKLNHSIGLPIYESKDMGLDANYRISNNLPNLLQCLKDFHSVSLRQEKEDTFDTTVLEHDS